MPGNFICDIFRIKYLNNQDDSKTNQINIFIRPRPKTVFLKQDWLEYRLKICFN